MPDVSALTAYDTEAVTVADSAIGLTKSKFIPAIPGAAAILSVETAQLRYLVDGTTPTASVGHLANPTSIIILRNPSELDNFSAIRTSSTSATLRVTYYR